MNWWHFGFVYAFAVSALGCAGYALRGWKQTLDGWRAALDRNDEMLKLLNELERELRPSRPARNWLLTDEERQATSPEELRAIRNRRRG